MENKIKIEVAYATPTKQLIIPLQVPVKTTVETAIKLSSILLQFPEINLATVKVGIFSKIVDLNTELNEGDRVEIYRPLTIDPNEARLLRAKKIKRRQA